MISKTKLAHWLRRYGTAEISGTVAVYIAFFTVDYFSALALAAGVIGAWAENFGFYGVIFYQRIKKEKTSKTKMLIEMLTEFGPAELLDSFFLRPACLIAGAKLCGPEIGVLLGKISSDILFYVPVIATYEIQQRWQRNKKLKTDQGYSSVGANR